MHWRIKGVIQKGLSYLPGGIAVNDCLQRTFGELRNFEKSVDNKILDDWLVVLSYMNAIGLNPRDLTYLEIGTGWFPTFPLCYALLGAGASYTIDLSRHLNAKLTFRALRRIGSHLGRLAETSQTPLHELESRFGFLMDSRDLTELLDKARITYVAPASAASTRLEPNSLDVIYSNSVLEHVRPSDIVPIMTEGFRLLRPGGVMIHGVNCGDHYAYWDRNITPINYLKYPEEEWTFWDNDFLYQNRLRPSDFLKMAEKTGFEIILQRSKPKPKLLEMLPAMPIASRFQSYSPEDLCSTSLDFVARKRRS